MEKYNTKYNTKENVKLLKDGNPLIIDEEYVLQPIKNAFNKKTSYWMSKKDMTVSMYCFSDIFGESDILGHLEVVHTYIELFKCKFEDPIISMTWKKTDIERAVMELGLDGKDNRTELFLDLIQKKHSYYQKQNYEQLKDLVVECWQKRSWSPITSKSYPIECMPKERFFDLYATNAENIIDFGSYKGLDIFFPTTYINELTGIEEYALRCEITSIIPEERIVRFVRSFPVSLPIKSRLILLSGLDKGYTGFAIVMPKDSIPSVDFIKSIYEQIEKEFTKFE